MFANDEPCADCEAGKGHHRQKTKADEENRNADECDRHPCCEVQAEFGPRTIQRLIDCLRFSPASHSRCTSYIDCPVSEPIQPAPHPRTPAPNSAPKRPGMASWNRPLIIRMPAKMRPPRQITAPAYIANVLNVPIKVWAPEKSIVP